MLTEIYIEALLVNEELADEVWKAWAKGKIDDQIVWLAWILISFQNSDQPMEARRQLSLWARVGPQSSVGHLLIPARFTCG